jgi:hypothetical protein
MFPVPGCAAVLRGRAVCEGAEGTHAQLREEPAQVQLVA